MKPRASCGSPGMNGPASPGSAITRSAGIVRPSAVRRKPPTQRERGARGVEGDAALAQQVRDRLRGGRSEDLERLGLRRHERDVGSVEPARAELDGGHDRELVGRQRPRLQGGDGHDEPLRPPGRHVVERLLDAVDVAGAAEGEGAGHRRPPAGADRDRADGRMRACRRRRGSRAAASCRRARARSGGAARRGSPRADRAGGPPGRRSRTARRPTPQAARTRDSGATMVIAGSRPASARSARIASTAATPPPTTTTRGAGGLVVMGRR